MTRLGEIYLAKLSSYDKSVSKNRELLTETVGEFFVSISWNLSVSSRLQRRSFLVVTEPASAYANNIACRFVVSTSLNNAVRGTICSTRSQLAPVTIINSFSASPAATAAVPGSQPRRLSLLRTILTGSLSVTIPGSAIRARNVPSLNEKRIWTIFAQRVMQARSVI